MIETKLKGSGGGGGGGSFKNTPDTLRSNDTFEGVLGLCIGPIKGPKKGMKSIKVDGTAIENETGEKNLGDFVALLGDGDPTKYPQKVQLKLGGGAAPTPVNLTIPNENAGGPGPWVTKTLQNTSANFIDLRFIVQQLFKQTDKGIFEHTLTLDIEMKPTGSGTWFDPTGGGSGQAPPTYDPNGWNIDTGDGHRKLFMTKAFYNVEVSGNSIGGGNYTSSGFTIRGKTQQPSVYELRVQVPNQGAYEGVEWDVRVRLREKSNIDSSDGKNIERRVVAWESLSAVYSSTMGEHEDWRGVSWLHIFGKASEQLTSVPEMTGEYDTKIVSVPPLSVFNPETRQYTGAIWDGSWSKAFTNDPAWVINDAISDPLSGLSLIAQGSYLNKWDALEASKWCSQLVPDGKGGTHPRYSMNLSIQDAMKAEEFIRYLAGAVGGLAWDQGDGEWRLKVDKPELPLDIFTLDNVEGEFVYSHTDIDTRYNDITMAFKNAEMDYREDRVRLYKNEHIARFGRKPTTMVAVGCTNRQEAMRRTKLRLESTTGETRIVNFTTNRRGRNVNQLDMILVADGDLGDREARSTGRTIAVSPNRMSITLRDYVRLEVGVAYKLNFSSPNPAYSPETMAQPMSETWRLPTIAQTRNITNTAGERGNVTVLKLDTPLPADIPDNLSISLSATALPTLPKLYRVLSVVPDDSNPERVGISALEVNTDKWDASDNVTNQDTIFQDLRSRPPAPLPPPSGPMLSLVRVPTGGGGDTVNLMGRFQRPPSSFVSGFRVQYSINGGNLSTLMEKTQFPMFEMVNPPPGIYRFEVRTIDRLGQISDALIETMEVTQALLDATKIIYNDGRTAQDLQPEEGGATVGSPSGPQSLRNDTFDPRFWVIPPTANRVVTSVFRTGYGVHIPFVATNDLRVINKDDLTKMIDVREGQRIHIRARVRGRGQEAEAAVTYGGNPVIFNGVAVSYVGGLPATFPLELAIEWLSPAGIYLSRSVVATILPTQDVITVEGSALAPSSGIARFSIGYVSQTGKTGSWLVGEPWLAEHQPSADNTLDTLPVMQLAAPVTLKFSHTGQITSPLPIVLTNSRTRGAIVVSPSSSWTASFPPGLQASINNIEGSPQRGWITITGGTLGGDIVVTSVRDGLPLTDKIQVKTERANAPTTTPSGTVATKQMAVDGSIATNSTFVQIGSVIPFSPVGSTATFAASLEYAAAQVAASTSSYLGAKWRIRLGAGAWSDVGAEIVSTQPAQTDYQQQNQSMVSEPSSEGTGGGARYFDSPDDMVFTRYSNVNGFISVAQSATGLTPAGAYEAMLVARVASGTVQTLYPSGNGSVTA